MSALQEIRELKNILVSSLIMLVVLIVFFFSVGFGVVEISGTRLYVPVPSSDRSFAVMVFLKMQADLVPSHVQLIIGSPFAGFVSQLWLAFLLSLCITFPYLSYRLIHYLSPAMYAHERRVLWWIFVPSLALFFGGAAFAYVFLIPTVFRVLYSFVLPGVTLPFLSVDEFIGTVFGLMVATGCMFLLPVCMALLTKIGIVPPRFWQSNWRTAVFVIAIVSAIITPDGSGVSMVVLALPLMSLYVLGAKVR